MRETVGTRGTEKPEKTYTKLRSLMQKHHELFDSAIPLVASENVTSYAVREAEICDFGHRYAEGWPGERLYAGCKYIDEVELICIDLAKKIFRADFADVRPISGVVANLVLYSALTKPGDTMMAMPIPSGGHISHGPLMAKSGKYIGGTAGNVHGLNIEYLSFDPEEMNINVDESKKRILELKPKLLLFGASVFLFPHPVKELSETAREVNAHVAYDAAHVLGLIAGKQFQDPLREGASVITGSTHKTLPGPQHGIILANGDKADVLKNTTFPSMVSNHHLHNVAALAVALAENEKFGEEYAKQIIRNAKALAQALYGKGFKVMAEKRGFTESHTILVNVTNLKDTVGLGGDIEKLLEGANIICNRNLLPFDIKEGRDYHNPGGIRLGTSEITRLGMKEKDMQAIAGFFEDILFKKKKPESVAKEVKAFRKGFRKIKYCFGSAKEAYKFIKLA